jgi:hypothetical protein
MPSPSATTWRASEAQTCVRASAKAAFSAPTTAPLAPEASSHRDAVEADLDGRLQVAVQNRRLDGRVGQDVNQHGGVRNQLRVNHASPLAEGGDANFFPIYLQPCEGGLLYGIGSHDRLGGLLEVVEVSAQMGGQAGQRGDDFFSRQRNADDAGRGGENLFRAAGEKLSDGLAGGASRIQPGLTGGAVGVAGVDGHGAQLASGSSQVLLVEDQRRGGDAVGSIGCGGADRLVGHDEGKVGVAALLEPRLGCAKAEAAGDDGLGCVAHINHGIQSI